MPNKLVAIIIRWNICAKLLYLLKNVGGSKLTPSRAGRSQPILELLKLYLVLSLFVFLAYSMHGPLVYKGAIPLA